MDSTTITPDLTGLTALLDRLRERRTTKVEGLLGAVLPRIAYTILGSERRSG